MSIPLLILVLLLIAALGYTVWVYNRLVRMRQAAKSSWSQIDVALRQRHDLVPRLTGAVAGYAEHELTTFTKVADARKWAVKSTGAGPQERGKPEARLAAGIGRLTVLAEDYPSLLATENFAQLQQDLVDVEERIAITRRVYNDTVETYNTEIQVFPQVLVARAFGFEEREFFDAPVDAELAPSIRFASGGTVG